MKPVRTRDIIAYNMFGLYYNELTEKEQLYVEEEITGK